MQALEGKNVKDMLLNVGSGGGAAAAPTVGAGGGATDTAPEEVKEEKKEEGKSDNLIIHQIHANGGFAIREGGVGRRHGFWIVRLNHLSLKLLKQSRRPRSFNLITIHPTVTRRQCLRLNMTPSDTLPHAFGIVFLRTRGLGNINEWHYTRFKLGPLGVSISMRSTETNIWTT